MFTLECYNLHALLLPGRSLVLPMIDLLLNPAVEIVDRGKWQIGLVGPQIARAAQVDLDDVVGYRVGIPVDQHPHAARQATWHVHLVATEQGRIQPAQLARRQSRVLGRQIAGRAEDQMLVTSSGWMPLK